MTNHYIIDYFGVKEYKIWFKILVGVVSLYTYIAIMSAILVYVEVPIEAGNIKTYGDAFWVLQMSASTIGFGDLYPVTLAGRVIVSITFYVGVGIATFVAATIAGIFTDFTDNSVQNRELMQQNTLILEKLYNSVQNKELKAQNEQILEQMAEIMKHVNIKEK